MLSSFFSSSDNTDSADIMSKLDNIELTSAGIDIHIQLHGFLSKTKVILLMAEFYFYFHFSE